VKKWIRAWTAVVDQDKRKADASASPDAPSRPRNSNVTATVVNDFITSVNEWQKQCTVKRSDTGDKEDSDADNEDEAENNSAVLSRLRRRA